MKNSAETRFNESVLVGETTGKCLFTGTCLNLKHTEEKYDTIRKYHAELRAKLAPTPHCIKLLHILFKNLQITM